MPKPIGGKQVDGQVRTSAPRNCPQLECIQLLFHSRCAGASLVRVCFIDLSRAQSPRRRIERHYLITSMEIYYPNADVSRLLELLQFFLLPLPFQLPSLR